MEELTAPGDNELQVKPLHAAAPPPTCPAPHQRPQHHGTSCSCHRLSMLLQVLSPGHTLPLYLESLSFPLLSHILFSPIFKMCPQPGPAASVGLQVMPSRPHLMVWMQTVPTTLCLRAGPQTPTEIINDYFCFKPLHFRVICCATTDKNSRLESCGPCTSLGQVLSARVGTAG